MNDRRSKMDRHMDAMAELALGVQPMPSEGREKSELMQRVPHEFREGMAAFFESGVDERGDKAKRLRMH
jgi:hypothetical protein